MKRITAFLFAILTLLLAACNSAPANVPSVPPSDLAVPEGTVPPTGIATPPEDPTVFDRGDGHARVSDVKLISPETGEPYEGCCCSVTDDNIITLGYPLLASDAALSSAKLMIESDGEPVQRVYDLRSPCYITLLDSEGGRSTYLIRAERIKHSIPIMQIYTDGAAPIVSKNEYVHSTLIIDGVEYQMKIKGRGNASWNTFPKKSYRIKLDEGAPLFGLAKNRDFTLTSNYADKSLIRNSVAHTIASTFDGLDFTSVHIPVDLYLNGEYLGVYTFSDKIEEGEGRLDFTDIEDDEPNTFWKWRDIGFLCEVGWDFDGENVYNRDYFDSEKVLRIYVKEPESEVANTPEFSYVKNYVLATEKAIVENDGWEGLIDLDSFVDWFIVTEFTFNTESAFYRSCYFWKRAGGKLMLGPVWDFDMAFGNHWGDIRGYEGWCTTESTYQYITENWMNFLITYDTFNDAVKERWNEKKEDLLDTALSAIDTYSKMLEGSEEQNFLRWDIMDKQVGDAFVSPYLYRTYESQIEYLRNFVLTRWEYMDKRINEEF